MLRSLRYVKLSENWSKYAALLNCHKIKPILLQESNTAHLLNRKCTSLAVKVEYSNNNALLNEAVNKLNEQYKKLGIINNHHVTNIMHHIESSGCVESFQALLLLRCCGNIMIDLSRCQRQCLVAELWNLLIACNVPLDVSHYNALLQSHIENEYEFSPIEFLVDMQNKNIVPNKVTYQRLINYYCKKGNISDACKVLECMKEKDFPLNDNVFHSLIIGHSNAGDIEGAKNIINIMKEANIEPTGSTYTMLMCAYAKVNDIESIRSVLSKCAESDIIITNKNIGEVLLSLISNNNREHIDEVLQYMNENIAISDLSCFVAEVISLNDTETAAKAFPFLCKVIKNENLLSRLIEMFSATMAQSNMSLEKLIDFYQRIEEILRSYNYQKPLLMTIVRESYMQDDARIISLLKAAKQMDNPIRAHYFWPILARNGQNHNFQGILDTLKCMAQEFQITPCIDTVKDYVMPYVFGRLHEFRPILLQHNIPLEIFNNAYVYNLLQDYKTRNAAQYVTMYPDIYRNSLLFSLLKNALYKTGDVASFVTVNGTLYEEDSDAEGTQYNKKQLLHSLKSLIDKGNISKQIMIKLVIHFHSTKTIIPRSCIQVISQYLGDLPDVQRMLGDITKVEPGSVCESLLTQSQEISPKAKQSEKDQTHLLFEINTSKPDTSYVESALQKLQSTYGKLNFNTYISVIQYLLEENALDSAQALWDKASCLYPQKTLSPIEKIACAKCLLKFGNINELIEYINKIWKIDSFKTIGELSAQSAQLVKDVIAVNNTTDTENIFWLLESKKYINSDNDVGLLILEKYISEQNWSAALSTYIRFCKKGRTTPFKHRLTKVFIQNGDTNLLQCLIDESIKVQGEPLVLVDLMFDFLEADCVKQAKKVAQLHHIKYSEMILNYIKRYEKSNSKDYLERLLSLSEYITGLNKLHVYNALLNIYQQEGNWQAGLNLWTGMQEDNILPPRSFLHRLASLLKDNSQEIPFVYDTNK